jgi:transposase
VLLLDKLLVGLDVSKNDYKVCMLDGEGERVGKVFALRNNTNHSQELAGRIAESAEKIGARKIFIGYESTSVYGWHLQYFLADSMKLQPYALTITCFNPTLIESHKKSLGDLPKTDQMDAFIIADRLRIGRLPDSVPVDFRYLALQRLTRYRFHIVECIVREKNYYLSNLFLKCSGLCQIGVFSDNFGAAAAGLINELDDFELIAEMPLEELAAWLIEKGREKFKNPEETAKKLQAAITSSYQLHPSMDMSLNLVLRSCLSNLKSLEKQKKEIEKSIKEQVAFFEREYTCLKSVKGIGEVIAAGLIAEIAGISRFDNDDALAKFAGIYWSPHQSADFSAEDSSLRRRGNKYLRYYFVMAADHMRKYLPEYHEFYSRKFKESKTHHHKRALILTSRKAVRLVFALLHDSKLYNPAHQ